MYKRQNEQRFQVGTYLAVISDCRLKRSVLAKIREENDTQSHALRLRRDG